MIYSNIGLTCRETLPLSAANSREGSKAVKLPKREDGYIICRYGSYQNTVRVVQHVCHKLRNGRDVQKAA